MSSRVAPLLWVPATALTLLSVACHSPQQMATQAASGNPQAQYDYACFLLKNKRCTPAQQKEAILLLIESTEGGSQQAPATLGLCYSVGLGTPPNLRQARPFLQIASDRNHPRAQLLLAHMYAQGSGAPYNPAKAAEEIRYAAMQGSPLAAVLMFFCFYDGFGVVQNTDLALGWLQNAADFGSDEAKELLKLVKNEEKSQIFQQEVDLLRKKLDFFPQKS